MLQLFVAQTITCNLSEYLPSMTLDIYSLERNQEGVKKGQSWIIKTTQIV